MEGNLAIAWQCEKPLLVRAIGPERGIDGIGNHTGCYLVAGNGRKEAGFAELTGKRRKRRGWRLPLQLIDFGFVVIDGIKGSITAQTEAGHLHGGVRNNVVPRYLLRCVVVTQPKHFAVLVVS